MNRVVSFFEKVGTELKKLFTNHTFEQQVQSTVTYIAPIVDTILLFVDPAVEPLVAGVLNTVKSDLATVSVIVQSAKVAPGTTAGATVAAALHSIDINMTALLSMAEIKNSAKCQQITAAVDLVTTEVDALLSNLPGPTVAVTA